MQHLSRSKRYAAFFMLFSLTLFAFHVKAAAAKKKSAYQIDYQFKINGQLLPENSLSVYYADGIVRLQSTPSKSAAFIDFKQAEVVHMLQQEDGLYKTVTIFDSLPQPSAGDKKDTILNYPCKYASFFSFSNTIEVWYTEDAPLAASPYTNYLPANEALVLKVLVNNTYLYEATAITKISKDSLPNYPYAEAQTVSAAKMEELKIKSLYVRVPVFQADTLHFNPERKVVAGELESNRVYHFSNGSVVLKKVSLPELWRKGARAFVDLSCWSNGDAYDRVGSVFLIPETDKSLSMLDGLQKGKDVLPLFTDKDSNFYQGFRSTADYNVPVELLRFATPFGVGYFNQRRVIEGYDWKDAVSYKQEVTALLPVDQEEVWLGVFIGNYDKGGHQVNLDLDFYPATEVKTEERTILPLFYTVNIMEMSGQNYGRLFNKDTLRVSFELEDTLLNPVLYFTSTGHGGWDGGDEFNPKLNQLYLDGQLLYSVVPWRTDCGTYRLYNPASGNFENGLSSSDYSRSNWCPGALTPPYQVPLNSLTTGKHVLEVVIDQGEQEGNSFSHWCVSGVLSGQ